MCIRDRSVDEFSYGILMIHMFSGMWPEPQVGQIRTESGKMIPVSEAERREVFLQAVGHDHPLMKLIHRCINNDPQLRPHASEIIGQLAEMVLQFPASFANRLEMLRRIEVQEEEKRTLREEGEREDRVIQQSKSQISICREDLVLSQQKAAEIDQLKVVHFSEVEQLRLQVRDLTAQNQLLNDEKEAEIAELKSKAIAYETQIEDNAKTLLQETEQFDTRLAKENEQFEKELAKKAEESETQLAKEREMSRKLTNENHYLLSELSKLRTKTITLQRTISTLKADVMLRDGNISSKDAVIKRNESELEAKTRVLQEKDAIISGMSEQLTRARECLATKQQVSSSGSVSLHQ